MLIIEAANDLARYFRKVPPVVFQNHLVDAMREFCRDSRVVLRTVTRTVEASAISMEAAPEGANILGILSLSGSISGAYDVGLVLTAGESTAGKATASARKISFFEPAKMRQQVKAVISLQPNAIDPWIPDELITGAWREAIICLTSLRLAEDLTIAAFQPAESANFLRRYRGYLSDARIEASNLGEQQVHRVPPIDLEGVSAPAEIAAPVPESEVGEFNTDFGSVSDPIASVVDLGGLG